MGVLVPRGSGFHKELIAQYFLTANNKVDIVESSLCQKIGNRPSALSVIPIAAIADRHGTRREVSNRDLRVVAMDSSRQETMWR
jgi:hypothetical protein